MSQQTKVAASKVAAASRRCSQGQDSAESLKKDQSRDGSATLSTCTASHIGYFDPDAPIAFLSGDLPHWRQDGVTYFVTFRLADSLPQEKLRRWQQERAQWLATHPEPHDRATRLDYFQRFPQRMQDWLDAGDGCCILRLKDPKTTVEDALRHFTGQRYDLDEFVVAPNHVHALVTPLGHTGLSSILHSWKSFTAHEIAKMRLPEVEQLRKVARVTANKVALSKVAAASRRCSDGRDNATALNKNQRRDSSIPLTEPNQSRDGSATFSSAKPTGFTIWQKESFDHLVRSPESLQRFRRYIQAHRR